MSSNKRFPFFPLCPLLAQEWNLACSGMETRPSPASSYVMVNVEKKEKGSEGRGVWIDWVRIDCLLTTECARVFIPLLTNASRLSPFQQTFSPCLPSKHSLLAQQTFPPPTRPLAEPHPSCSSITSDGPGITHDGLGITRHTSPPPHYSTLHILLYTLLLIIPTFLRLEDIHRSKDYCHVVSGAREAAMQVPRVSPRFPTRGRVVAYI